MGRDFPVVKVKKVNKHAKPMCLSRDGDAGADLCTMESVRVEPHCTVTVGCGYAFHIPRGYYGTLVPREDVAARRGITLANAPGTVDSNYHGEVMLHLHNMSNETQFIERGERVCRVIFVPYGEAIIVDMDKLDEVMSTPDSQKAYSHGSK